MTADELRELDAWIAENVMGKISISINDQPPVDGTKSDYFIREWINISKSCPRYTTDPAAAMEVLERCLAEAPVEIYADDSGYGIDAWGASLIQVNAETLPICICMLAKRLFGKEH